MGRKRREEEEERGEYEELDKKRREGKGGEMQTTYYVTYEVPLLLIGIEALPEG